MKIQLRCNVDSNTEIFEEIKIIREARTYIFHPNDKYILHKITIISDVTRPEDFYSEYISTPGLKTQAQIILKKDKELYESIIRDFQEIESLMTPILGMKKIYWENAEYNVIPETDEERFNTKVTGWNITSNNREEIVRADKKALEVMLDSREKCQKLIVPLSFYREGNLELNSKRYINAFYNFYFVIEGLYGNNKTKNKDIANEFKDSKSLTKVIEIIIEGHDMLDAEMKKSITEMLNRKNKEFNIEGIIELLVLTRGELHHFTNNPNRPQGTPFNHEKFKDITLLLMVISLMVLVSYFPLERDEF